MALALTIAIVVLILGLLIGLAIFKKVFKLFFYVGMAILIILLINFFFVFKDFYDIQNRFDSDEKKIILVDDEQILTGFVMDENIDIMTQGVMDKYSENLKNKELDEVLGGSYKLMVFEVDMISEIESGIQLKDEKISSNEAVTRLKSRNYGAKEKASIFSFILADEILSPKNPVFFFSNIKTGNIMVYPETALFKTAKMIPISMFKGVAKKIFQESKRTAEILVEGEGEVS